MISRSSAVALLLALVGTSIPRAALASDASAKAEDEAKDAAPQHDPETEDAEAPSPWSFDIAPAAAVPLGSLMTVTGPALGGVAGGGYALSEDTDFTAHVGYLSGSSMPIQVDGITLSSSLTFIPMLAGVRYRFGDYGFMRPFLQAEGGVVLANANVTASAASAAASSSASAANAGTQFSIGLEHSIVELHLGFLTADVGHPDTSSSLLMVAGLHFASL